MATWRQQALIDAPVREVWELLCDRSRAPEWAEGVIAITGGPAEIERGSTFTVTGRGPLGLKATTPFKVEELEDMHELKMKCQVSGFYSHWLLTEAQEARSRGCRWIRLDWAGCGHQKRAGTRACRRSGFRPVLGTGPSAIRPRLTRSRTGSRVQPKRLAPAPRSE